VRRHDAAFDDEIRLVAWIIVRGEPSCRLVEGGDVSPHSIGDAFFC
jgi:hypothetical protein